MSYQPRPVLPSRERDQVVDTVAKMYLQPYLAASDPERPQYADSQLDNYMLAGMGWPCTRGCGAELGHPGNQALHNRARHLFLATSGHDPELVSRWKDSA